MSSESKPKVGEGTAAAAGSRVATASSGSSTAPAGDYAQLNNQGRARLIELAKELILARLRTIDWQSYPSVRVFKSPSAYRVEFRTPIILDAVNDRGAPPQDYVDVTVSAHKTSVSPPELGYLYKPSSEVLRIAKLFLPTEAVVLTDRGDTYEARVSHRATDGPNGVMSGVTNGGSEAYSIDKKTLEKKLLWHEHPQAPGRLPVGHGLSGDAADEWVEISK